MKRLALLAVMVLALAACENKTTVKKETTATPGNTTSTTTVETPSDAPAPVVETPAKEEAPVAPAEGQ